ncbi:polysaccharide pyruvyl transferase family protein [soil metagenome]
MKIEIEIMTRRDVLRAGVCATLAGLSSRGVAAGSGRSPVVLLRSGWQTVNIGDIGHTPGVIALLEEHLPDAEVILWASSVDRGVAPMLRRRFPGLKILRDSGNPDPQDDEPTIAEAIDRADFLLHGSGPSVVGASSLHRWRDETDKPYGIFGVTIGQVASSTRAANVDDSLRSLLDNAAFLYTRETKSLELLRQEKIACPDLRFVPDGTFAIDLRDDEAADRLMAESGLEADRFLCVVPRLRVTPYWDIHPERQYDPERIREGEAINAQTAEPDHARLREAIALWVRETGLKVLICPEMTYQVKIIRPLVFDPLPEDVKGQVVPLDRYWLPDEAGSVYRRARAVLSVECHSPIIALAHGTPAIYIRQPTDTWKGEMYRDVGLPGSLLEIEATTGAELADRLLAIHNDPDSARAEVAEAMHSVQEIYRDAMAAVHEAIGDRE